jgi:hypothetical protein
MNQSFGGWVVTEYAQGNWLWGLRQPTAHALTDAQVNRNYFFKNEWRPNPYWFVTSLIEWNQQTAWPGWSQLSRDSWRWHEKIDVKIGYNTRLTLQYRQAAYDLGYQRHQQTYEPSVWLEHRWRPDFQNIFSLLFRRRQVETGVVCDLTDNWEAHYELIWRQEPCWFLRRVELRQHFSGNHNRSTGQNPTQNFQLGASSYIDLYPAQAIICRLRLDYNQYLDGLESGYDYSSLMFNLKITLRF